MMQQTGFRADKDLLNRFRSRLAREGRTMGGMLVRFIRQYLGEARLVRTPAPCRLCDDTPDGVCPLCGVSLE